MAELLSVGQVAKRLGVSVDVVRSLEERGELKSRRTPGNHRRYHPDEVERVKTKWRAKQSKPQAGRASSPAPRPATTPMRQSRPVEWEPDDFGIEEEVPEVESQRAMRDAEREAAKHRADAEAKAVAAAAEAERQRLEGLKKYGRDLATWAYLPTKWRAKVVEDLEEFVISKRLPSSLPQWDAQQIVKSRVDGIIKQYHDAEDQRRKQQDDERRINTLIAFGKGRAQSETMFDWDTSERDRARREVEEALKQQVKADWSEGKVQDVVDDVLSRWKDDEDDAADEEDMDEDFDEDDVEKEDDEPKW